jgi:GH43 family beta-xylosidase
MICLARVAGIALASTALTTAVVGWADDPLRASNFYNVVKPAGADPWVFRHADGRYYALVTTGRNVTLIRSRMISALGAGERKVVFVPPLGMKSLWAPELYWIDRAWYVYFAADNGANVNHRMFVLENTSGDPFQGTFALKGKIAIRSADRWATDGTLLRVKDRTYFVWSGWDGTRNEAQNLYIAPMKSPWTVGDQRVLISWPTLAWEKQGGPPSVNEGPQVLARNEDVFLVYSAAASWTDHYALGLLTLTRGADPLVPQSWTKSPAPVFASANGVFGPGHCSFTKSPDDREDWIIYHAAKRQGAGWSRLVRAQRFEWNADGTPNFGVPWPPDTPLALPGGEPARIRIEAETGTFTGTVRVSADPSASGGAKVGRIETPASSLALTIGARTAGTYTLVIRSRNGSADNAIATHDLYVNGGKPVTLRYENAGWDVWSNVFVNVELKAGVNSLRVTPRENLAEIDCVDFIPPP